MIELSWVATAPVGGAGFAVERGEDGLNFSEIGRVPVSGGGAYSLRDADVEVGRNYAYRIHRLGGVGNAAYSPVFWGRLDDLQQLSAWPNPSSGTFYISSEEGELTLFDPLGRRVSVRRAGRRVETAGLPMGVYLVQLRRGDQVLFRRVIID